MQIGSDITGKITPAEPDCKKKKKKKYFLTIFNQQLSDVIHTPHQKNPLSLFAATTFHHGNRLTNICYNL